MVDLRNNHVRVDPRHPSAKGMCQRCGWQYQLSALNWQYEFIGATTQNKRLLVCPSCLDQPNENLRVYSPGPDPVPKDDPSSENANMS